MTETHELIDLLRPRLEVRHLSTMVALDQAGTVTRAAEQLGITQPALSRQIREAERRLGTALYTRERKRLRPTLAGECLLQHAKRILADIAGAESDTVQIPAGPRHVVRFGAGAYGCYHWLPGFLSTLQDACPDIDLSVSGRSRGLTLEALLGNEIDVALVPGPIEGQGLRAKHLFQDELVAILPPNHPLAGRPVLEATDLADQTYVTYGPTYRKGFETDRVLRPARVWPKRLIKVDLVDAIVTLVAAGVGVSVLSRWAVARAVAAGSVAEARVTEAGLPIAWSAVVRRNEADGAAACRLLAALDRWCAGGPERLSGT